MQDISATDRALNIEYAIRDVVVPATELEAQGHSIIKLNIGDPIAYPGLPTPPHMVEAFAKALNDGKMVIRHPMDCQSYVLQLRTMNEQRAGLLQRKTCTFATA